MTRPATHRSRPPSELRIVLGQLVRRLRAENSFSISQGDRPRPGSTGTGRRRRARSRPPSACGRSRWRRRVAELQAAGLVGRRRTRRRPPDPHRADRTRARHARRRPPAPRGLARPGDRAGADGRGTGRAHARGAAPSPPHAELIAGDTRHASPRRRDGRARAGAIVRTLGAEELAGCRRARPAPSVGSPRRSGRSWEGCGYAAMAGLCRDGGMRVARGGRPCGRGVGRGRQRASVRRRRRRPLVRAGQRREELRGAEEPRHEPGAVHRPVRGRSDVDRHCALPGRRPRGGENGGSRADVVALRRSERPLGRPGAGRRALLPLGPDGGSAVPRRDPVHHRQRGQHDPFLVAAAHQGRCQRRP